MKKPTYFVQYDGPWICVGHDLDVVNDIVQADLQVDNDVHFKCRMMSEDEIEAMPEGEP
jgi:hypothetical protein